MAVDYGKKFEEQFKKDWNECMYIPHKYPCVRLYDQVSRRKTTSTNPCDFICYAYPYQYMIETKSHLTPYFPISCLTQYENLLKYSECNGVIPIIIIWFRDYDKVVALHIKEVEKILNDGFKSISIKMINDKAYNIIEIPSVKKRTMMTSDYSILIKGDDLFGRYNSSKSIN